MEAKSIIYNSVTVSLPKNVAQFLLGAVLFWVVYGSLNIWAAVALVAFLMAYSSVYFFNDITDCEDDRCDEEKKEWKLVASGKLSKREAGAAGALLLAGGISLSALVNGWFLVIMLALIFLNFLHSSPYIRLKKRMSAAAANITAIEFLKYSCGWFALTSDLTNFPFWLILCFSLIYSAVYLAYKFRFRGMVIKGNKHILVPLGAAATFSYMASLALYDFALPMLFLLAVSLLLAKFSIGKRLKFMNWLWVEFAILPIILVAFLMLAVPPIAQANGNISVTIDTYRDSVYHSLPEGVAENVKGFGEPRYASLDELQKAINSTVNISMFSAIGFFLQGNNK